MSRLNKIIREANKRVLSENDFDWVVDQLSFSENDGRYAIIFTMSDNGGVDKWIAIDKENITQEDKKTFSMFKLQSRFSGGDIYGIVNNVPEMPGNIENAKKL